MKILRKEYLFQPKGILLIIACLLFAGAYSQLPLFYNNQHTKFLAGLAKAGYGYLSSDWYVQQTDNIPVFSIIVYIVQLLDSHWMFYFLHGILTAIYALSLFSLARRVFPDISGYLPASFFFTMLMLLHSPWIGNPYVNYVPDWSWMPPRLQTLAFLSTNGMAGQYVLGPFLQASAFGVFIIASIALFVYEKTIPAVVCAVFAATVETPYILHAAVLTGAYMVLLLFEQNARGAVKVGGLALLLVLPITLYVLIAFYPASSTTLALAQKILIEERTPHHLNISHWFSQRTCIQLIIVTIGLVLSFKFKRLFVILSICVLGSVTLSAIQFISGSQFLAMLSPWRLFTWLIPITTALGVGLLSFMASNAVSFIPVLKVRQWIATILVATAAVFLVGMFLMGLGKTIAGASADWDRETVISYAKKHASKDQTYLIPLMFEQFRLPAGVPVFVDWKSHPFKDVEFLEWYKRVQLAKAFYEAGTITDAEIALNKILEYALITHIVAPPEAGHLLDLPNLRIVFRDKEYNVFRLEKVSMKDSNFLLREAKLAVAAKKPALVLHNDRPGSQTPVLPAESQTFTSPILGAKFILIPAGTFTMGSPATEPGRDNDEGPNHQVTISQPFYMQTTEITQGQWRRVVKNSPSYFSACGDDCPVEQVSGAMSKISL